MRAIVGVRWLDGQEDAEMVYVLVRWYSRRGQLGGSRMDVLVWDTQLDIMLIPAATIIRPVILQPHPDLAPARWVKPTAFHMPDNKRVVHNLLFDDLP